MIRLLKALFDWLDKRYPPKLTVRDNWIALIESQLEQHKQDLQALRESQMLLGVKHDVLGSAIAGIKDALAKGQIDVKPAADRLREDFIAGASRTDFFRTAAK